MEKTKTVEFTETELELILGALDNEARRWRGSGTDLGAELAVPYSQVALKIQEIVHGEGV